MINLQLVIFFVIVLLLLLNNILCVEVNKSIISPCNNTLDWSGISSIDYQDKPYNLNSSLIWKLSTNSEINLKKPTNNFKWNLSTSSSLQFYLKVDLPNNYDNILLYFGSENPATSGIDYYSIYIPLKYNGWRKFVIKRSNLATNRTPLGWDQIDTISFKTNWGSYTTNKTLTVRIAELSLLDVSGPMYSDNDVFMALDLTLQNLTKVNNYYKIGDLENAKLEYCNYLKNDKYLPWSYDYKKITANGISSSIIATANKTVNAIFDVVGVTYQFPDPLNINWNYNPTAGSGYGSYTAEWTWQLNRFPFWNTLAQAYWYASSKGQQSLADIYLKTFLRQFNSWIVSQPLPSLAANVDYSAWRTIEAGIRLGGLGGSWPNTFLRFLNVMPCNDLFNFVRSFLEHANYLYDFQTSGNWLTMECNGLYTAGAMFPEFKDAKKWRDEASEKLYNEIKVQFLPDGAQYELSTGYHHVAFENIIGIYLTAKTLGYTNELPKDFIDGLERALVFDVLLMTPSGYLPLVNDAWDYNVPNYLKTYIPYFNNNRLMNWVTNGRSLTSSDLPNFNSVLLPYCGFVVMRQDWSTNSHYAFMDIAPLGYGHDHQDKLHIILEPYGRSNLLFDSGGGNYETSVYRSYALSTESHNTILVDGLQQKRQNRQVNDLMGYGDPNTPKPIFENTTLYDYAKGVYQDGYGTLNNRSVIHERELIFIKETNNYKGFWIVIDNLKAIDFKYHNYDARWHLRTTNVESQLNSRVIATTDLNMPNLAVVALNNIVTPSYVIGQVSPNVLGWNVTRSGNRPATSVLHKVNSAMNTTIITCFIPLRNGESHNITNVEELENNGKFKVTMKDGKAINIQLVEGRVLVLINDSSQMKITNITIPPIVKGSSTSFTPITSFALRLLPCLWLLVIVLCNILT
ncbi:hypothetical protein ABK040_008953 [Willaertia magna]